MENKLVINVTYCDRIDKYIAQNSNISRSDVKKLISYKSVFVGEILVQKTSFKVKVNQVISVTKIIPKQINATPEKIAIEVVYEDKDIVVVNKASGMVVHPAPGNHSGTLVNALLFRFQKLSDLNGRVRPGIVHRLDKDTSGLLMVAKHNEAHAVLAEQLQKHLIKRAYLCWVKGRFENDEVHINLPVGRDVNNRKKMAVIATNSKPALTRVFVLKTTPTGTLLRCELETGRTHQIRVHLAHIHHPIIGDPLYGQKVDDFGQQLHAYKLEFNHPVSKKRMAFEAEPPPRFLK